MKKEKERWPIKKQMVENGAARGERGGGVKKIISPSKRRKSVVEGGNFFHEVRGPVAGKHIKRQN